MSRRGRFLILLVLCAASGACVRVDKPRAPLVSEKSLFYSRSKSKGTIIQWNSQPGQRYTIEYRDPGVPGSQWQPLPGAVGLVGTGESMQVRDVRPGAFHREYRRAPEPGKSSEWVPPIEVKPVRR